MRELNIRIRRKRYVGPMRRVKVSEGHRTHLGRCEASAHSVQNLLNDSERWTRRVPDKANAEHVRRTAQSPTQHHTARRTRPLRTAGPLQARHLIRDTRVVRDKSVDIRRENAVKRCETIDGRRGKWRTSNAAKVRHSGTRSE